MALLATIKRTVYRIIKQMHKPETTATSAASLLGTVTMLVQDTQVDVTRLIYMLYQDIEQQINRADLKAQITLSTSAVLMAMLVNLGTGVKNQSFANMSWFEGCVLLLYLLFIICMSCAFGRGIAAAFPRAVNKISDRNRHPNLYFSAQIAAIPGALLIPLDRIESGEAVEEVRRLTEGKTLYVHCKMGGRSAAACKVLSEAGYDVTNLESF